MSDEQSLSDESEDEPGAAVQAPQELRGAAPEAAASGGRIDLDLLRDVQVQLCVEIGRTKMPIRDLLALHEGAIVNLQRGIAEPMDLMVNGTLIARGEVVESGGQFGLRLLDVVSPSERLKKLK